jgi:glucosamine 6-phosphate synthetase-like amidotransferase/phosphosugar isomerase protein
MCGIFGYILKEPLDLTYTLEILKKLEVYIYPGRSTPIGGHGAGVAYLTAEGKIFLRKVGKTNGSPVSDLIGSLNLKDAGARVLLSHVRRASPQFNETIKYGECTQPYRAECLNGTMIISVHNGFLRNYIELKDGLSSRHQYESAKVELIDSEVFPHVYEELVEAEGAEKALERLFCATEGTATVALLSLKENERALSLLHKDRTVGFSLWTNSEGEVVFCSRWEPVEEFLGELLNKGGFKRKVFIDYREPAGAYFYLKPPFL